MKTTSKPVFKIRCSAIGDIMSDPKGGQPIDKYNKAVDVLNKLKKDYEKIANKATKTADSKRQSILKAEDKVNELEKGKDEIVLSKTCQSYVDQWIKENYYGRRKNLNTKAIQKGIECETEAVFVLNKYLGTDFSKARYGKGERMENERCTGHEDIDDVENSITYDTKVCESIDTFPILKEDLDKSYWRQGQGYMWLKGEHYKKHIVAKVLVNTPVRQLKNMMYHLYSNISRKYDGNEEYIQEEYEKKSKELFLSHVFDRQVKLQDNGGELQLEEHEVIPYEKRVRLNEVERDDNAIAKIVKRVEEIRKFLAQNGY